nr:MAG TPA: hypothetical protein [Caudoviricetes sp.]
MLVDKSYRIYTLCQPLYQSIFTSVISCSFF